MPSSRPIDRLRDVITNCERIAHYVGGHTRESYLLDTKTADAVERCLQRISEAAMKLGSDLDERYPDAPWREARGIGNILRHRYEDVVDALIWESTQHDLPRLEASARAELARLEKP